MNKTSHQNQHKVIIVGDVGVGKTSILQKFIVNKYDENNQSTLGATFRSKNVAYNENGDTITLQFWDTAG